MIKALEQILCQILIAYYNSTALFGLPIILLIVFLFIIAFKQSLKGKYIPGATAIVLTLSELMHWFFPQKAAKYFENTLASLNIPGNHVSKLPDLIEPAFSLFVAPLETRYFHQEIFFVALVTYLCCLISFSIKEYKRTGEVVGDFSIGSVFSNNVARPNRSKTNELGSGDLASTQDLQRWTKASGRPGDTSLFCYNLYGADGLTVQKGQLVWPREERNRHILTIAKTGGGKTTRMILPILYNDAMCKDRSTIVIDSKPEMWSKLAQMTKKYNPDKRILLFNPLDVARSMSWNILSKIEDDTDCKLIAQTLIAATDNPNSKSDSPFFKNNALSLLNCLMVGLLGDPNEVLSMPRVHELVQSGMRNLCDWIEAHPESLRTAKTFVDLARSGSQNADTIMSELSMRISAWDLKAIRTTTAVDEFDIEDLIRHPTLFIIEFRESEIEMLRPLANVIVIELLRFLTKRAEKYPNSCLPRPVGFVIDEFASALGRLPDIHVKLNTLRSRNVSIVAAIQSIEQVKSNYGDDGNSVLAGFSSKILIPNLDFSDSEWASKETGQMTIRFETSSSGSNRKIVEWFASKNVSTQEQVQQRAVLTPDEIGRPADNRATFFLPNTPPFQGFLTPFYETSILRQRITEFDKPGMELKMRERPIDYIDVLPHYMTQGTAAAPAAATNYAAPAQQVGLTNTTGWSDTQVAEKLTEVKDQIGWAEATGSAKQWWEAFESENKTRMALVLSLSEELLKRKSTITDFFLAYIYANTDDIEATLHYLDYTRLKKKTEDTTATS